MKSINIILVTISCLIFSSLVLLPPLDGETMNKENIEKQNIEKENNTLLAQDKELSKTSAQKGLLAAFLPYLTPDSFLLPLNGYPVLGKDACQKCIETIDMKKWETRLTWEPLLADTSAAGDIGYTHGRLNQTLTDTSGSKKVVTTYYGTIWKKDTSGNWKIAVSQGLILTHIPGLAPILKQFDESQLDPLNREIVDNELSFSAYAVQHGVSEAFYRFMDDAGIAISGGPGFRKKEFYLKAIAAEKEKTKTKTKANENETENEKTLQTTDKNIKTEPKRVLEWEPYYSFVSSSQDMAYDYGPYTLTVTDETGKTQYYYGYFATVWKKQTDKTWKFVMDCGNQSPGITRKK